MGSFDITRQLCRGDLIFSPDTITVLIKWSKTLQNRTDTTTICIPALGIPPLCPYRAMALMLKVIPGDSNDPLFRIPRPNGLDPLKVIGNTFQQNFEYNFIAYTNTLGNIKCGLFFQICNMRATDHSEVEKPTLLFFLQWMSDDVTGS